MSGRLKHASHLAPLALVFLAGLAVFLVVRHFAVPKDFGQYGHYRPGALKDIRNRPVSFAGQASCAGCHEDVAATKAKGKHARLSCEGCHGPLAKHADDPSAVKPKLPAATSLCKRCHEADQAKPPGFPQVVSAEHSGGAECLSCHQPHSPQM